MGQPRQPLQENTMKNATEQLEMPVSLLNADTVLRSIIIETAVLKKKLAERPSDTKPNVKRPTTPAQPAAPAQIPPRANTPWPPRTVSSLLFDGPIIQEIPDNVVLADVTFDTVSALAASPAVIAPRIPAFLNQMATTIMLDTAASENYVARAGVGNLRPIQDKNFLTATGEKKHCPNCDPQKIKACRNCDRR